MILRMLRIIGWGIFTFVSMIALTVLFSWIAILVGFSGDAEFPVDCGIVFGAAISGRNTAGPAILRRIDGAAELWRKGDVSLLILTGGKGDSWRLSEAAVMRQEAVRAGVDGRDILTEEAATSTKENLAFARPIVEKNCSSVVAISDQYHLARIKLLAKRSGWGRLMTYGVPERPERGESRSVVRELLAYLYYAFGADAYLTFDEYDNGNTQLTGSGATGA